MKKSNQSDFQRVESNFRKPTSDPSSTTNILKFIIDLVMNLNEVTKAVHGDPKPLLKIINDNLGSNYSTLISRHIFNNQTNQEQDPNMIDPYIDHEDQ